MDKYKGIVEKTINGRNIGFKFGTGHFAMLCELEKDTLANITKRLDDPTDLGLQINYYYAAAVQYVRLKNAEDNLTLPEPSKEQVANWIDMMMPSEKVEMNEAAFSQYENPNVQAPEAGQ
jgi:hypothetical protein